MEVDVKVKKVVNLSNYECTKIDSNLSIVEQDDINKLVSNYLKADFKTRKYILHCSNVTKTDKKLIKFFNKFI
jgi:hypothetical protein